MDALLRDLRFAVRQLTRERAFTAVVLLTLAVCIGANVTVFSVVETVVLRPLPYPGADRLVTIYNSYPGAGAERGSNSGIDYFRRRDRVSALDEVAVYQGSGHTVGDAGRTERLETARVSASFFPLLGVEPALGRTFTEEEEQEGEAQKVVLTHGFWAERFGGAADAIGRELRVDGRPYSVIGVLPEDFRMVAQPGVRFFVPIVFSARERSMDSWHNNNFQMLGRLATGATIEQARAQIAALNESMIAESTIPNARQLVEDIGFHTVVVDAQQDLIRDVRPLLHLLWGGAAFVLLIGCVNVAGLMLARAQARMAELTTRLALGAERSRLVRQVLTEAVLMAVLAAAVGLGLGWAGLSALGGLGLEELPRGADAAIDGGTLVFTLTLAILTALAFGTMPALHAMRGDLNSVFRQGGRGSTASRRTMVLRGALVTSQVALAFVLLMGAGLMVRSFRAAAGVDPGFEPDRVLTAAVALPLVRYADDDARRLFVDDLLREAQALPGAQAVGVADYVPFGGDYSASVIFPEGWEARPGESVISPYQTVVSPGYFDAMGIELLDGRMFEEGDGPDQPNVIVIDEQLARRFWPDRSPIGQRMIAGAAPGDPNIDEDNYFTIIGVVETVKHAELTALDQVGAYYFTYREAPIARAYVVMQVAGDPTALTGGLRGVVAALDSELPLFDVQSLADRISRSLVARRAAMVLLTVFGGVALFLAVVGIYGLLAYAVAQRTREVGIRMALGSSTDAIFRLILRQGLGMTLIGLLVGGLGSLGLARLIRSQLFGVTPADPVVLAGVAAGLAGVAGLASALPAWRATRVDPVLALHG
jgi:predicted permease